MSKEKPQICVYVKAEGEMMMIFQNTHIYLN